ncbi:hypothetical protein PCANC_02074 [Puccinia coronata f. sp. avenae]|uniref:Uncharacterized protein n=1 Tax=Puccinia coronata f. sp. avenae TaxID=200324 RepID=A0A2N5VZV4_9BASI|nr:hypothetical protein PCANC_02074 [Puccinia coronata f. sp. avenae]
MQSKYEPEEDGLRGAGAWSATAPLCALIGQTGRATELIKVQLARDGPGPWRGPRGPGPPSQRDLRLISRRAPTAPTSCDECVKTSGLLWR